MKDIFNQIIIITIKIRALSLYELVVFTFILKNNNNFSLSKYYCLHKIHTSMCSHMSTYSHMLLPYDDNTILYNQKNKQNSVKLFFATVDGEVDDNFIGHLVFVFLGQVSDLCYN